MFIQFVVCLVSQYNCSIPLTLPVDPRLFSLKLARGAQWPSGRVSDPGARGRGFDTYLRRIVSLRKGTFTPRKVLIIPRKRWLRPDMTEKLLTETLSINTNKQTETLK